MSNVRSHFPIPKVEGLSANIKLRTTRVALASEVRTYIFKLLGRWFSDDIDFGNFPHFTIPKHIKIIFKIYTYHNKHNDNWKWTNIDNIQTTKIIDIVHEIPFSA